MIDLHCHILPDVDDGAESYPVAFRMAALALDSGVDTIVATPHCNNPNRGLYENFRSEALDRAFAALQQALDDEGLPLRVLPGCELLLRGSVGILLDAHPIYTLAGSRYQLVEFYFDERPQFMDAALAAVAERGRVPLIAHPERYFCVQDEPAIVRRWYERGYGVQLNKSSLLGDLSEAAYDVSRRLLRDRLCHVIASDAHGYTRRTPSFRRLTDELAYFFPERDAALLLERNPQNVLDDKPLEAL